MKSKHRTHLNARYFLPLVLLWISATQAATQQLDKIVAIVDNDVVMQSELEQRTTMVMAQLQTNNTQPPPEEVLRKQILEQLISESLQLQIGYRVGIDFSTEELDQTINRMKQANNLSDEEFQRQLALDGITINKLREQIKRDMIIDQVQKGSVNRRIQVTEQEVENFLKSKQGQFWASPDYQLGHILIALSSGASAEQEQQVQAKAQSIHQRLVDGADFRQMAVTESQGQNALQGGDLGWRKSAQMPDLFARGVESLRAGDITPPLRSGAGFHILKVYNIRGAQEQVIEQSKVRHILVKPSTILADEEARAKLAQIRADIVAGGDFAAAAKEHSEDPGSMLSGGDLGWSLPGKFVPEFERTINSTPVGEISEPFRSQFGWHILQVEERRNQDMSDTVRRNQANRLLRSQRFDEERINWLQELRDEAYVEIK